MTIQIAKNNSIPSYSVLVEGLWDCDCATNDEQKTIKLAVEKYPNQKILMWDNPSHYSNL